jgi:hypothetical protein
MSLDDFIIACFCLIDDALPIVLKGKAVRSRGPAPKLADSEVITMEVVGTYLGLSQDKALYAYFRQHYSHFFPQRACVHRSTFVRQAANLWVVKERIWCLIRDDLLLYDETVAIFESVPVPACRFARATWCRRFRGLAAYGKDHSIRQTFYGFRLHARVCWPGVITRLFLAGANETDPEIAAVLTEGTTGLGLGDRHFWHPQLQQEIRAQGVILLAPYRLASSPQSKATESPVLGRVRYRIDTVFGQLTDRCQLKRVWARDLWHLRNRLLRMVLMHTLGLWFNQQNAAPLLQLERVVA